ncbi:hypothetical protein GEMRC1_006824 [Eukaryota sp. GEM-RC1]
MRLRLAIWPANLLNYSTCSCGANGVFRHLINCRYFIHLRAVIHDGVRDSCYSMFKAHGFHSKVEPVLNHLSENEFTDQKRGDLHTPWLKSSQALMDFTTVDVCNKSCVSRILDSSFNPLTAAEKLKHTKYDSQVEELNRNSYSKFVFQPFAVSLFGSISPAGDQFFKDFEELCKEKKRKFRMAEWKNRIVFSIYRNMPFYFSRLIEKLYKFGVKVHVDKRNLLPGGDEVVWI